MDRISADDDVVLADPPSTSGAHWANRDNDALYRRPVGQTPFRRPPAVNSFPDDDLAPPGPSAAAFPPESTEEPDDRGWFDTGAATRDDGGADEPVEPERHAPAYGPAPPAAAGRTSFGVTSGPISPSGRLGDAPTSYAARRAGGPTFSARRAGAPTSSASQAGAPTSWASSSGPQASAPTSPAAAPGSPADAPAFVADAPGSPAGAPAYLASAPGPPAGAPSYPAGAPGSPAGAPAFLAGTPMSPARGGPAPEFGEFVVGPSHEIRPHRAARRPPAAAAPSWNPPSTARPARRSRTVMIATIALTALVLVAGAVTGVMLFSGSDRSLDSVFRLGGGAGERTVSAALGGRTAASFELLAATTKVTVKAQDLGGDLYRITSAENSGTVPSPVLAKNRVQLHLTPEGTGATGKVTVLLSSKVKWTLRFVGGADEQAVDLRGGRVASVDVLGAARRLELALPTPSGTVPVRLTGAVEELSITAPQDSPVRVRLDSGAKTVAAGERTLRDVQPGSTLTPQDWQTRNRYDVHAESRITLLSVAGR